MNKVGIDKMLQLKNIKDYESIEGLNAIFQFGSTVNGKVTPLSDIDMCLIGTFSDKNKRKIEREFFSERLDISFFDELPIWIKARVLRDGKCLFVKNKKQLVGVAIITMNLYEDLKPLIKSRIMGRMGRC